MSELTLTLPDGSQRRAPAGSSVAEFAAAALPQGVTRRALAAVVDGRMVDLTYRLDRDASVRLVTPDSPEALPSSDTRRLTFSPPR